MSTESLDGDVATIERLGLAAAVLCVVLFGVVGGMLFGDPLFGSLVGLVAGVGVRLLLPYAVQWKLSRHWSATGDADSISTERGRGDEARNAAAGFALATGGELALAGRFAVDGYLVPFGIGAAFAALAFVVLSYALPELDGGAPSSA